MTELEDRLAMEVDRALRYHRPLGVVMLRLEGAGDAVLAHVDRLLRALRRMDLVAEYGPDELAVVLPETSPAGLAVVARRAAGATGLTIRCGAASFPEDGSNPGALIGRARERLRGARTAHGPRPAADGPPALPARVVVIDPLMKQVWRSSARSCSARAPRSAATTCPSS